MRHDANRRGSAKLLRRRLLASILGDDRVVFNVKGNAYRLVVRIKQAYRIYVRTYLDGAALRLGDGRPVVALTLRYDRLDNFWFCLPHELAHVGPHMDHNDGDAFVDDLTLRSLDEGRQDPREAQADEWAEEALLPRTIWETSTVREHPTPMTVLELAQALHVHPAIVAGRVRYERRNYRLLSQFVGTGEVRRQFPRRRLYPSRQP